MSRLTLATAMALLASLPVPPGSLAQEPANDLVVVEATVLDDLGQPVLVDVCAYLDVSVT